MAEITGATFNFNKTVTDDEPASTPDKPADSAKIETKVAGEKKGKQSLKDYINLSIIQQTVKTTVNSAMQNIEGSQMVEQASALQSVTNTVVSSLFMAATNPYLLLTSLACKGVSYAFQQAKFNRDKAWQDYDLEEYRSARGYSAANNRSRG